MRLPFGLRWWELLPELLLALGLGVFFVMETDAATSAFKSSKAITLMVVAGVVWIVARVLLVRYTHWPVLRLVVFALAGLGVLWIVVFPAYDDTTVVEALPVAPEPAATVTTPPVTEPGSSRTPTTTAPATPVAVRMSMFRGIDHRASGNVVVYRQPDRSLLVGLEDIDIQPGPDYDVYIVPGANREDIGDAVRLDDLRGNKGTQYYEVPAGTDVTTGEWTVLVWCETFDVPIAGATPA
jgi:hypothetical protein